MNCSHYIHKRLSLPVLLLAAFLPGAAHAGRIYNLAKQPVTIEVESSDGYTPLVIEAGSNVEFIGNRKLKYEGREVRLEYDEEYAIWPDGSFGLQRRMWQGNNGF